MVFCLLLPPSIDTLVSLGMVAHTFSPSTWGSVFRDMGISVNLGQFGLHMSSRTARVMERHPLPKNTLVSTMRIELNWGIRKPLARHDGACL